MRLDELARGLAGFDEADGAREIAGLTADSRKVAAGTLFAALPGSQVDGLRFVDDAVAAGAGAVLTPSTATPGTGAATHLHADDVRRAFALMAARFHGAQPATMAAVTGTAGKTSVASFTRQIWALCGEAAAQIGTTGVVAPGRDDYGTLTTPDPVELHRLLAELANDGVTHCAFEASSHGIEQRRLDGVELAVAAFTNLGRDHLDYHADMEDYFGAKMRLFDTLVRPGRPAVVYMDDEWSERAATVARERGLEVLDVGRKGHFLCVKRVEQRRFDQVAQVAHAGAVHEVRVPFAGEFQLANALVAAAMCIATGTPAAAALGAIESLKGAPGRLEVVARTVDQAPVYVDYAHKPDALENVLAALRPYTTGRLILVFGCGGDRDRGKRPIMGEIAQRMSDVTIVTDDNPRSEEPAAIRAAILDAAPDAIEIGDRREAIDRAVAMAGLGDTVVIAGKGHEPGQTVAGVTHPFSDHEEARRAVRERGGESVG